MGKKYIKKDNIHVGDICKPINTNLKKEYLCYGIYDGIAILLHISKNVKCRTVTIKREDAEYVVNCETTQKLPLNSLESSGIQVSKKQMDKIRTKHQKWKNELAFKKKKNEKIKEKIREKNNKHIRKEYKYDRIKFVLGGAVNPR